MKLHIKAVSERGKEVTKSGNEFIKIMLQDESQKNRISLTITANKTGGGEYTGTLHILLRDIQDNHILYGGYIKEEHSHKWEYAGMCEGEEGPKCGRKTYTCSCGAYKDCDGGIN